MSSKSQLLRGAIALGLASAGMGCDSAQDGDLNFSLDTGGQVTATGGVNFETGGIANATGGVQDITGGVLGDTGGVAVATGGESSEGTGGVQDATGGVQDATGGVQDATGGVQDATGGVAMATGGESNEGTGGVATDAIDVAVEGSHSYDTFVGASSKASEYAEGLVYYPTDSDGPFPVMVLSPGWTASNTDYQVWGRMLSSHGIVALLLQPTAVLDVMALRAADLLAGVDVAKTTLNETGPLAGKIDTTRVGIMGHSMGGGGTLIAAEMAGHDIQVAIPLQPYEPNSNFDSIVAPTLIIGAELDAIAGVAANAQVHYDSIPASTVKVYVEAAGADHYYSTDRNDGDFEINARYAIAFMKLYLQGDTRYEGYLYGSEHQAVASQLSTYQTSR